MKTKLMAGGIGLTVLLMLAGCGGSAIPSLTVERTDQYLPGDDGEQTSFTTEQIALANDVAEGLGAGQAVMTVTSYADYRTVFQADTVHTDQPLGDKDNVVVVAMDGSVSTASIKWAPFIGPIPEAHGTVIAVDEAGRLVSRLVLFEPTTPAIDATQYDPQGAVERLTALGTEMLDLN